MTDTASPGSLTQMLHLVRAALSCTSIRSCCQSILSRLLLLAGADQGFIHISDPRLAQDVIEISVSPTTDLEQITAAHKKHLNRMNESPDADPLTAQLGSDSFTLLPIRVEGRVLGILGLATSAPLSDSKDWQGLLAILGIVFDRLASHASSERKLRQNKVFREVSSMLARPAGLEESLELALFSVMSAVSAEASSILLLDESREAFHFYHSTGIARPLLGATRLGIDEGIAGSVLQTLEAEIVNNVAVDPRFNGRIDSETGFQTRSLMAAPLFVGNEPVGVIEVLNSKSGEGFSPEDRLLLVSLLDSIAYAIQNAMAFDRLASAYCRRRLGKASCEACASPLDSWAPCVAYREDLS